MQRICTDDYQSFHCIASACRHSCCVGWEIDIDEESFARYRNSRGPLAEKLRRCTAAEPEPHFILSAEERCPFLNERGLCEIILTEGEGALCEICREHPRFYHFLPGVTEVGVGLCCEEAARMLVQHEAPIRFKAQGKAEPADEECEAVLAQRAELIALAQDRSMTLEERMERLLSVCDAELNVRDPVRWARYYQTLERLDEAWSAVLEQIRNLWQTVDMEIFRREIKKDSFVYENLLVYFLYRHFTPEELSYGVAAAVRFVVLSTGMILAADAVFRQVHGELPEAARIEHIRLYSSEIEYSAENMSALLETLA